MTTQDDAPRLKTDVRCSERHHNYHADDPHPCLCERRSLGERGIRADKQFGHDGDSSVMSVQVIVCYAEARFYVT